MGSCVSVHKNSTVAIPPSPIKHKPVNDEQTVNGAYLKPPPRTTTTTFADYGSKEAVFFDSQPWFESDSEDFFSVNGDFTPPHGNTPSRGNTPIHPSPFSGPKVVGKVPQDIALARIPKPPPTSKKKKLAELFQDSQQEEGARTDRDASAEAKQTILDVLPSSNQGTPCISGPNSNSGRTPDAGFMLEKQKPVRSMPCCLPRLASYSSFSERNKKLSSATPIAVHD